MTARMALLKPSDGPSQTICSDLRVTGDKSQDLLGKEENWRKKGRDFSMMKCRRKTDRSVAPCAASIREQRAGLELETTGSKQAKGNSATS